MAAEWIAPPITATATGPHGPRAPPGRSVTERRGGCDGETQPESDLRRARPTRVEKPARCDRGTSGGGSGPVAGTRSNVTRKFRAFRFTRSASSAAAAAEPAVFSCVGRGVVGIVVGPEGRAEADCPDSRDHSRRGRHRPGPRQRSAARDRRQIPPGVGRRRGPGPEASAGGSIRRIRSGRTRCRGGTVHRTGSPSGSS
jgi:hypothetical protein